MAGGINPYVYVGNDPLDYIDPTGTNPLLGAVEGAEIGSLLGPAGTVAGSVIGFGLGTYISLDIIGPMLNEADDPVVYPDNPESEEAKGRFTDIKKTSASQCDDGSVWEPDTSSHGGEQWKRWPNRKSWEKRRPPTSVWPDGRIRK